MQLLLVHGIGSNSRNWRSLLPALAASREVIAVNLPGHGKTMWGEPDEVVRLIRETIGKGGDAHARSCRSLGWMASDRCDYSPVERVIVNAIGAEDAARPG